MHHLSLTGKTSDASEKWKNIQESFLDVEEGLIVKNQMDAFLSLNLPRIPIPNHPFLYKPEYVPNFFIKDSGGEEFYSDGLNCGYNGSGPSGTVSVLQSIMDIDENTVYQNQIIEIEQNSVAETKKSDFELQPMREVEHTIGEVPNVYFYYYGKTNKRILIADSNHEEHYKGLISYYLRRYLSEVQAIDVYLDEHAANKHGLFLPVDDDKKTFYNVILHGIDNRQLWLAVRFVKETPLKEQTVMNDLLRYLKYPAFADDHKSFFQRMKQSLSTSQPMTYRLTAEDQGTKIHVLDE